MTAPRIDGQGNHGATAISNAMTKLHRERYGRGPNSVRTVVGHDHEGRPSGGHRRQLLFRQIAQCLEGTAVDA